MKCFSHDVFSIILLHNLYIFTAAQSKAQTDYFVKINETEHISIINRLFAQQRYRLYTCKRSYTQFNHSLPFNPIQILSLTYARSMMRFFEDAYSKRRKVVIQRDNKMTKECPFSEICWSA